jgi:hypothetical protein
MAGAIDGVFSLESVVTELAPVLDEVLAEISAAP